QRNQKKDAQDMRAGLQGERNGETRGRQDDKRQCDEAGGERQQQRRHGASLRADVVARSAGAATADMAVKCASVACRDRCHDHDTRLARSQLRSKETLLITAWTGRPGLSARAWTDLAVRRAVRMAPLQSNRTSACAPPAAGTMSATRPERILSALIPRG